MGGVEDFGRLLSTGVGCQYGKLYHMDIENNKPILQTRIKRFTFKATAQSVFLDLRHVKN